MRPLMCRPRVTPKRAEPNVVRRPPPSRTSTRAPKYRIPKILFCFTFFQKNPLERNGSSDSGKTNIIPIFDATHAPEDKENPEPDTHLNPVWRVC